LAMKLGDSASSLDFSWGIYGFLFLCCDSLDDE